MMSGWLVWSRRASRASRDVLVRCAIFFIGVLLTASPATAQQEGGQPEGARPAAPKVNQPGKDVQWVPTPPALVEKMLDMAAVTPKDRLVDLGSGDGVLVIAAAKRGVRARGIEYDRGLVEFSKRKAAEAGVSQLTRFVRGDIFETDFSDATVVTTFLLPSMNLRLRPTFLAMKPGTRIVANTFAIGDWQPDESAAIDAVRALVHGADVGCAGARRWHLADAERRPHADAAVSALHGHARERRRSRTARLRGDAIAFTVGGASYAGRVDGDRMRVSATVDGRVIEWTARPARRR